MMFCALTLLSSTAAYAPVRYPTPPELIQRIADDAARDDATRCFLTCQGTDLSFMAGLDCKKYPRLEGVVVEFTADPADPDEKKEKVIAAVERNLVHLSRLKQCPRFRYLVLHTGEFLFIRAADRLPCRGGNPAIKRRADLLNLERTDRRFGKRLDNILPGVTVYAHNWEW